jgi:hypothetical protein
MAGACGQHDAQADRRELRRLQDPADAQGGTVQALRRGLGAALAQALIDHARR